MAWADDVGALMRVRLADLPDHPNTLIGWLLAEQIATEAFDIEAELSKVSPELAERYRRWS